ncbi:MAG: peptidylprolyl isomerase [Phycisphaerales bacterium]|nr:peptidylprolyl isomerase [Phycisphaerales bacterium]
MIAALAPSAMSQLLVPPAGVPAAQATAFQQQQDAERKEREAKQAAADALEKMSEEERYVHVALKTNKGEIVLELDKGKAPVSVENFVSYVESGHYDGTIFHRVIKDFMIQGGGFTPEMNQKPTGKGIKNEWQNGLKNVRGSIAMARLGNQPDSATAQFFINVQDNAFLDQARDGAGYAVFGKVVEGMDVVDTIRAVGTGTKNSMGDVPLDPVIIEEATIVERAHGG